MPQGSERKNRGCFFYGCLTFVLVLIGVIIGGYFGTKKAIKEVVKSHTATAPVPIPTLNLSAEEQQRLATQVQGEAEAAMNAPEGERIITLDENELNAFIAQSPDLRQFTNQFYLTPGDGEIKAQLSLPLDQFQGWLELSSKFGDDLKGRYLNGTASLLPAVTNGHLILNLKDLVVNGTSLPDQFTGRLKTANLAEDINKNEELRKTLEKVESIDVKNGQLRIEFK